MDPSLSPAAVLDQLISVPMARIAQPMPPPIEPDIMLADGPPVILLDDAGVEAAMPDGRRFSPFDSAHAERVVEAAQAIQDAVADQHGPTAIAESVRVAAQELEAAGFPAAFVRHAVHLARVHVPKIKEIAPIASLESRAPHRVAPSLALTSEPSTADEHLRAFREDPGLNDHHEQWHFVYPGKGWPRDSRRPRQGEMFIFMHRQKLARYDADRLPSGGQGEPGPVVPIAEYDEQLVPYDPASSGPLPPDVQVTAGVRPDGARIVDSEVTILTERRTLLREQLDARQPGAWGTQPWSDVDHLGSLIESSLLPAPVTGQPVSLHNRGHNAIANITNPPGPMIDPDSSMRDPVFWQWHRHIDDFAHELQAQLTPTDLSAGEIGGIAVGDSTAAPIVIVTTPRLPAELRPTTRAGVAQHFDSHWSAISAWVADRFDELSAEQQALAPEVRTWYSQRTIAFAAEPEDNGVVVPVAEFSVWTLDHDDLVIAVKVHNANPDPAVLTLRWFLCPEQAVDDRRMWFELDKQVYTAPVGDSVAVRAASQFAAVRKPARRLGLDADNLLPDPAAQDDETMAQSNCNCGLPYTLVLPRGREPGMPFRLYVCATDNTIDTVRGSTCGSMTYCPSTDDYPDQRPMGYPFDRPAVGDLMTGSNRTSVPVTLRHLPGGDPGIA